MNVKVITVLLAAALCMAMVPAVAATGTIIDTATVTVNNSYYKTIDDISYNWSSFFGIFDVAGYSYTWQDGSYSDRKEMQTLTIGSTTYPSEPEDGYEWKIVSELTENAVLYKKCLGGYADNGANTYYAWYGDKDAATAPGHGRDNWFYPTLENATYVVQINVNNVV